MWQNIKKYFDTTYGKKKLSPIIISIVTIFIGLAFFLAQEIIDDLLPEMKGTAIVDNFVQGVFPHKLLIQLSFLATYIAVGLLIALYFRMLQENQARMESIWNCSPDLILRVDPSLKVMWANSTATKIRPDIEGKICYEAFAGRTEPCEGCKLKAAIASGKTEYSVLERHGRKGNKESSFWESVSIPIMDEKGGLECLVQIERDITERKIAEEENASLIKELETRNAELEQYAYTISHDLKTPLITIGGFLGIVKEDLAAGKMEKVKEDIQRASAASEKMEKMMDELMELSRVGMIFVPSTEIEMKELINEAIELANGRLEKNHVKIELAPNFPVIFGNRPRLLEVVMNLIDNGAKFMGNQPDPLLQIGYAEDEGEFTFHIRDNGIGIEQQFHEKVFQLFDKLNKNIEGNGVGLALSKRIISNHGGKIWFESEGLGKGSTFKFSLPKEKEHRAK